MDNKAKTKHYRSIEERWDWLISTLILDDPFAHRVLLLMDKKREDSVGTMGVYIEDARLHLRYNKAFIESLTDNQVRFVIKHEALHIVLHHVTHRAPFNPDELKLFNSGHDLAINTLIPVSNTCEYPTMTKKDEKGELKTERMGLFPDTYGFDERLSSEVYVELLRKQKEKGGKGDCDGEGEGESGEGEGGGKSGKGEGGSGDGGSNKEPTPFDNHDGWSESEIADELIRQTVQDMVNHPRMWGDMSADMVETIIAAQTKKIAWHKLLRHYGGNIIGTKKISTFKKPNRRFGYPYSGYKRDYIDKALVAIDTSASVDKGSLSEFLGVVNRLSETISVDLLLFDAKITQDPKPFKKSNTYDFAGRGGTDFSPVMTVATEKRYKALIVLTDGYASAPDYPKGVKDVIWVITEDGECPVDWGKVVKMD